MPFWWESKKVCVLLVAMIENSVRTKYESISLQALLHPYFFAEPLPAHHSELPIPQRTSKKMRRVHQAHDYNVDTPLAESLLDPDLIAPHVHIMN